MGPEETALLFGAFVQTELGRKASEGTGLGLALSRAFARRMDGDITVTSEKGRGSVFRVEVALPLAPGGVARARRDERRVRCLEPGSRAWRLLVADDNNEGRMLLAKLLASVGFTVVEATDGREALDAWLRDAPDFVWMDVSMPRMDGLAATRAIRSQEAARG